MIALIKKTMIWIFGILIIFIALATSTGFWMSAPKYNGPESDHFNGKKFINPGNVEAKGFKEVLKWSLNREPGAWEPNLDAPYIYEKTNSVEKDKMALTFVNHSTFLIQTASLNILTDPVWSERTSPVSFAGPKRMRPPGIRFEDLPDIDIVLISHNHYDHLDVNTLKRLQETFAPTFVAPLGVKAQIDQEIGGECIEMDWWDEIPVKDLPIACVPAQHFSGRGISDRDATLWAGYVIVSDWGNVYFAGDTGYGNFFKEIARQYPPKLSLLPIGAYLPKWFMSPIHTSPEDAVQIHLDMESPKSIGIHYGTFPLADDGQHEPIHDLKSARAKHGVPEDAFMVLKEGETTYF
jgi:L-ascorbate metabolism protein UlaG (beta-lactamase superfamily)